MTKQYKEIAQDIAANLAKLRKEIPDVMGVFSVMAQSTTKDEALDKKAKELVALALGVAVRCDSCRLSCACFA
jgi:alkylhydroperoxidase/carboxymuconolactone decarboxylase family protein YurZ